MGAAHSAPQRLKLQLHQVQLSGTILYYTLYVKKSPLSIQLFVNVQCTPSFNVIQQYYRLFSMILMQFFLKLKPKYDDCVNAFHSPWMKKSWEPFVICLLKVRQSRKQFLVYSNPKKMNAGKLLCAINCFPHSLTFNQQSQSSTVLMDQVWIGCAVLQENHR